MSYLKNGVSFSFRKSAKKEEQPLVIFFGLEDAPAETGASLFLKKYLNSG